MDNEYAPGTTKGKIKFLLFLLFLLSIYLIITITSHIYLPEPKVLDDSIYKYSSDVATANIYTNIFMLCIYIYGSIAFYKFGNRIKLSMQYPPPNAYMPFKMKYSRGKNALLQAYSSYATSVLLVVYGIYELWHSVHLAKLVHGLNYAF